MTMEIEHPKMYGKHKPMRRRSERKMSHDEIRDLAEKQTWYHAIELFPGYTTKSYMEASFHQWDQVREVRKHLDYTGKSVLDIGTMDGMWAFEAEKLGARVIYGSDIWQNAPGGQERFEFAIEALDSNVVCVPGCNVERLNKTIKKRNWDIIQFLGVLYHIKNPMVALENMADLLAPTGKLFIETAVWPHDGDPILRLNSDEAIYCDSTTIWAPNMACLHGMLKLAGLAIIPETVRTIQDRIHRVACIAERL